MKLERISQNWWRAPGGTIVVVDGTARRYVGTELVGTLDVLDDVEVAVRLLAETEVRSTARPVPLRRSPILDRPPTPAWITVLRFLWRIVKGTAEVVALALAAIFVVLTMGYVLHLWDPFDE